MSDPATHLATSRATARAHETGPAVEASPQTTAPGVAPVRVEIVVDVPRDHAFTVFTERFDAWWPRSHHIGRTPLAEARMECRAGGRWYEIATDGRECDWGTALTWEPPERVVLVWQLSASWTYDPGLRTRVEIRFTELTPHRTLVVLEHQDLDQYGDEQDAVRSALGSAGGWPGILRDFAATAAQRR